MNLSPEKILRMREAAGAVGARYMDSVMREACLARSREALLGKLAVDMRQAPPKFDPFTPFGSGPPEREATSLEELLASLREKVYRLEQESVELGGVRATLLVNFGPLSAGVAGVKIEKSELPDSTERLAILVLERLVKKLLGKGDAC